MSDISITLKPEMRLKLDEIREEGETHVSAISRLIDAHKDAGYAPDLSAVLPLLDTIREPGEAYSELVERLVGEHIIAGREHANQRLSISVDLCGRLDDVREGDEAYHETIERLIEEHKTAAAQRSMTPKGGTTEIMRVRVPTRNRIVDMSLPMEDYDDAIVRLLDERSAYREVAMDMATEARKLLLNQDAIIHNYKLVVREIVTIDTVTHHSGIIGQGVDELAVALMSTPPDEGDVV